MTLVLIVPEKNRAKTVHLDGGRTSNGTKIQLWNKLAPGHKDFLNQVFVFNGILFRSRKNPSKCLHLDGGRTGNGTKIQLWDVLPKNHHDVKNQRWILQRLNIVSRKNTSGCWHLDLGHTHNGTKIHLWNKKNHPNGSWRLQKLKMKIPGHVDHKRKACLIVPLKNRSKTVHLVGGRTHNGTKIQLWNRLPRGHKDFKNQLWLFDGTIFRSGKDVSKCLHLDGGRTGNGTKIQLWDVLAKGNRAVKNQEFRLEGKNIVSRKNILACWHLDLGHTGNGTKIHLWKKKNHVNGAWRLEMLPQARM